METAFHYRAIVILKLQYINKMNKEVGLQKFEDLKWLGKQEEIRTYYFFSAPT